MLSKEKGLDDETIRMLEMRGVKVINNCMFIPSTCIYLKDNKCTIHNTKPDFCKRFFCDSCENAEEFKKLKEMIR